MFSFQGAGCTKIDVDGCKNAIEPPQQALFLQNSVDFCFGKCVTDLPQLEFDAILILVQENGIDSFVSLYLHILFECYQRSNHKLLRL